MKFDSQYTKTKTIHHSSWRKRVNYKITSKKYFKNSLINLSKKNIQNSVFDDEIILGKLEELKIFLLNIIDKDSIIVFSINNPEWIKKQYSE